MVGGGHRFEPHWMEEGVTGHTGKQRVVLLIEKPMHHTPSKKNLTRKEILRSRLAHVHAHRAAPGFLQPPTLLDVYLAL